MNQTLSTSPKSLSDTCTSELLSCLERLRFWVEERDYAGHEPYDLLNSPWLGGMWRRSHKASALLIQAGRRFAGSRVRNLLAVPVSKNPKALGLFLAGYCDLARCGGDFRAQAEYLRNELVRLRAPEEREYAWGYDWNFASLRGGVLPAFAANSVATVFCAEALLDASEVFDNESLPMARSAGRFCVTRLNRSRNTAAEVCFSYTPSNYTLILNNSVLVGALLARLSAESFNSEYLDLALRSMNYLASQQRADGAWVYGASPTQQWVDSFHTGYNLSALAAYRRYTRDSSFDPVMNLGYEFYKRRCFTRQGVPKYFEDSRYPVDIHACTQAVMTFCDFVEHDTEALPRAIAVARWMTAHMQCRGGSFYYQRHRFWTNRTPYMRWANAWAFRALARLIATIRSKRVSVLANIRAATT